MEDQRRKILGFIKKFTKHKILASRVRPKTDAEELLTLYSIIRDSKDDFTEKEIVERHLQTLETLLIKIETSTDSFKNFYAEFKEFLDFLDKYKKLQSKPVNQETIKITSAPYIAQVTPQGGIAYKFKKS